MNRPFRLRNRAPFVGQAAFLGSTALVTAVLLAFPGGALAQTMVTGSTLTVGAPEANGVVVNNGGILVVAAAGTVMQGASPDALVVNNYGNAAVLAGGTVSGTSTRVNRGTLAIQVGGQVNTNVTTSSTGSTVFNAGTIGGDVVLAGSNGTLTTTGTITGGLTINSAHSETMASGMIGGDVLINTGRLTTIGALTVGGSVTNNHELSVTGGDLTAGGAVTNNYDMILGDGRTVTTPTFNNNGRLVVGTTGTINGDLVSTGGVIDMQDGVAGDTLMVTGDMSGASSIHMDIDLTAPNAGFADTIMVGGTIDGDVIFKATPLLVGGVYTLQANPIVLIDGGALGPSLNLRLQGLPQTRGLVVFNLRTEGDDIVLTSGVNPLVGGVSGAFSAVQGLIGTIVNRPGGAFASGVAFDTPDNCSTGSWARALGGRVSTRASSTSGNTGLASNASLNLDYTGMQGGIDFGCFESFNGGWDISGGMLLGFNRGTFLVGGSTSGEFAHGFAGLYMNAASGNFSGEMQLRQESGAFSFMDAGLGLDDTVSTSSTTFSGSFSYRHAMADGWSLVPSAGLSISRMSSGTLSFTAPASTLQVADHTNRVGFAGLTVARTIAASDTAAYNVFGAATLYRDFSDARDSLFTSGVGTDTLTTQALEDYNEISIGASYIRVLPGTTGVRQFTANLRADYRFGGDLRSAGVTAQFRLQF